MNSERIVSCQRITLAFYFITLLLVLGCCAEDICEEGWTSFCDPKHCFCYYVIQGSMPWSIAHGICKEKNSHLVSIHSREERDYVYHTTGSTFWTGLNDQGSEGVNTWTDGTPVDYTEDIRPGDVQSDCYALLSGGCHFWQPCLSFQPIPCSIQFPAVCKKPSVTRDICPGAHGYFCSTTKCSCYYFSRYEGNNGAVLSWDEANVQCASMGGYLTSVHSEDEARHLHVLVKGTQFIWIGMQDKDGDGVFTWVDRSAPTFLNWITNEPSNVTESRSCVMMRTDPETGLKAKWAVEDCSRPLQYICKRDKNLV